MTGEEQQMSRTTRTVGSVVLVVVLGAGAYLTADAYDYVPGMVTFDPPPEPPEPFPTAPGAVVPPAVAPVLAAADPAAPAPSSDTLTAMAINLVEDERMGGSSGVVVADGLTGAVLADVGSGVGRTPASVTKLFTGLAALVTLHPDRTLSTTVVQPEPGRLVLVGGGDMLLAAGHGDPEAVNGRAGLADLAEATARALKLSGTTEVRLAVDDSLFSGPSIHPDWVPSDVAAGYVAAVSPLAVNMARTRDTRYPPRYSDPPLHATQTFAALLADQGIAVVGGLSRATAADGAPELARVESAPVRELLPYAMHLSENTLSEVLGRLVAIEQGLPGSFQGATAAVLAVAEAQGLDVTSVRLSDCSGLAATTRIPAGVVADLLLLGTSGEHPGLLPLVDDLPVAGWQGTVADRFGSPPALGLVRAKTGSLPGVTSLAGTVWTQDGRQLVFVVLADRTPEGGQWAPRAAIDTFVQKLAGCGCRPS